MKKNILKKFIVLLGIGFILLGANFVNVNAEEIVALTPLECVAPQVLNEAGDACMDVVVSEALVCTLPQVEVAEVCTTPVVEPIPDPVPEKLKEQVIIRNGDIILYDGFYELPEIGTVSIPDKDGVLHDIDARSVIAILYGIDSISDNFSISNLEYSNVYDSLYMKCLTPNEGENLCDNWQYVVNDSYPYVGMDKNILAGNEKIYIYFGQQNRVLLNKSSIKDNEELIVTAEKYDYEHNLWLIRSGVIVGVTKPDPANPWSPNDEIQKKVDDTTGVAIFSSVPEGEYNIGVKEDYYWPTEKLIVAKFIPENNGGSGGGSSTPTIPSKTFSVSKALEFLISNKRDDDSFGDAMYTDWVAIALEAGGDTSLKSSLINYLKTNPIEGEVITDYERRAMALLALGINPYDGTDINYIKKIIDSFDGTQFGDSDLINDDIFALIVLKNAGYSAIDEMIIKDTNYIISKQSGGSWGSIDMTSAGLQALRGLESIEAVDGAISNGELYLISNQKEDSGFENSFSTSWALQALYTNSNILKAENYLTNKQQTDGGLENITDNLDTRIWATAYAIPAIMHKSWNDILNDFPKQIVTSPSSSSVNEEIKEEVIVPLVLAVEDKGEEIIQLTPNNKINKILTKTDTVKNIKTKEPIIVKVEEEIKEGNPLSASVGGESEPSNGFYTMVHKIIAKIKAPFIWFLIQLGF